MNLEPIFDFGNAGWNIILERFGRLITADYPSYQFYHAFIERQSPQPWRDDLIHYRSAFQDIQRHLLRIWVTQGEQVQSRPPGVISYRAENTLSARHKASAPYAMTF
ncbi:hypothetical protein [Oceanospirillum sediminis]|uniref:Uncharacterized protein n=1 Tax=Oceanospirillum sediminis TaxID=2760088 RepID=A0A839IMR4_9GAMM|nr:hypothetical protein [Oceanospirillum sediminis]MBB1486505.1 hypothetical protein [Oceanospirillum sediminis]